MQRCQYLQFHPISAVSHPFPLHPCTLARNEGNAVEQGTHKELMELGGRYFELVKLQSLERLE